MTNAALNISFLTANPHLYEPILSVDIKTPKEYMGAVMGLISQHRGRVENTVDEGDQVRVVGILPTAETLGDFADKIRSATSGRSFWGYQFKAFEPLPTQMEVENYRNPQTQRFVRRSSSSRKLGKIRLQTNVN